MNSTLGSVVPLAMFHFNLREICEGVVGNATMCPICDDCEPWHLKDACTMTKVSFIQKFFLCICVFVYFLHDNQDELGAKIFYVSKHPKGRLGTCVSDVTCFNHGGRLGPS